jgi:signal transduction histidine kinase
MSPGHLNELPPQVEVVARALRHEVGDLLQTVYSTVAILQDRTPPEKDLERRLLSDLKARAETCKLEIDSVVDLVCAVPAVPVTFDLAHLVGIPVEACARRFPSLRLRFEGNGPAYVLADPRRIAQAAPLIMLGACQSAQRQVHVRVASAEGQVEWAVADDGPGASDELLAWLVRPFTTTHHAQFGLGLALARHVARLHGGEATGENLPGGGFRFRLTLPECSPPGADAEETIP